MLRSTLLRSKLLDKFCGTLVTDLPARRIPGYQAIRQENGPAHQRPCRQAAAALYQLQREAKHAKELCATLQRLITPYRIIRPDVKCFQHHIWQFSRRRGFLGFSCLYLPEQYILICPWWEVNFQRNFPRQIAFVILSGILG